MSGFGWTGTHAGGAWGGQYGGGCKPSEALLTEASTNELKYHINVKDFGLGGGV